MYRALCKERGREISSLTKNVSDGAEVSLRRPTHSSRKKRGMEKSAQERMRKKKSACSVRNDGTGRPDELVRRLFGI